MDELPGLTDPQKRLTRLTAFLDSDPDNLNLIGDACSAALDARRPDVALELLARYQALAPLPPALRNLEGLAAIQQDRFEDAIRIFEPLLANAPDDAGLRFNLAWSKTMTGDHERAADLLDEATATALPAAAALKVQALHRLGHLEAALQCGEVFAGIHPHDRQLMGALSLVAVDSRLPDKAREWASRSQDTAEGLSALGVLSLQDLQTEKALAFFDSGLKLRPDGARNLLGKGLALMAAGDVGAAAGYIDQSARLFEGHLGTWIAAGWAHFACGDRAKARVIFEHALALDDTFSESHGALAVLDILDGDIASGRRRTDTALRLDQRCFAGALAKSLLLDHDHDPQSAKRVRDIALNTPLESGQTLAQVLTSLAPTWRAKT